MAQRRGMVEHARSWQREEWEVELAIHGGKSVYRIFHEVQSGEWFVQGMYD